MQAQSIHIKGGRLVDPKNNVDAQVVELSGSVEIAPKLGTAELICDLVSSGATLAANQLKPVETLLESEAVLAGPVHELDDARAGLMAMLLRRLDGVTVENADAGCCGISGSYGFKKEKYDIAQTVGSELFAKVRESGAQAAVSECGTCRVQITHGSGKFSLHPVTILRQRLEAR